MQTVGQRVDRGGHVAYKARQTLRRTILGNMLRRAREAADVEVKTVVQATGMSQPVVYRQEDGIAPVPVEKIPALAELYEVTDPETIAKWTKWAEISATKGPWGPYGNSLGPSFEDYADVESLAREIRAFEPVVIHGLLQTKAYSEEAIRASDTAITGPRPPAEGGVETDRMKLREARKTILDRVEPAPPRLWVILGEAAVLTPPSVTNKTAHPDQVRHLLDQGEMAATIQVLPMETGLHTGLAGSFSLLTLDDNIDMIFREGYHGDGSFSDDPDRVRSYRARYEQLISQALSPAETRRYLHGLLKKLGS
ncbi:helix-turn-helix domain-containing protein (plasmid) [Streptomyces sp. RLB1-9]|uniref:helix-turn-helix domain-containing protein n=1 Tax=Streptomyces sp. RLB1-9 TaxID=2594454 RepID=UPI0011628F02|nr:helix-turn-helix transcriptional regulator [Streptomyces sp. RLB1-9]QDN94929.1 helix-turn-helix domain-containing protein [Streptomyces sp. RLB1-9]